MYIAPELGVDWFFSAARRYWERFRPTVVQNTDLLYLVPDDRTVTVSLLTRRDSFQLLAVEVAQAHPTALLDVLVYESAQEAQLALDSRAETYQPFGVPLRPTAIPPTREPIPVTPGSILGGSLDLPTATPNESGFNTATPQPPANPGFITQTPTPSPTPNNDDPQNPIDDATPGSILGG